MTADSSQSESEKTSSSKRAGKPQGEPANPEQHALIGNRVLNTLGRPADLFQIQVRPLFGDRFRVNVLVGPDAASVKVAHSFFLVTDRDGNILASTPQIMKEY